MAKAAYWTVTDVEARKRGEQTGLDTLTKFRIQNLVRVMKLELSKLEFDCSFNH